MTPARLLIAATALAATTGLAQAQKIAPGLWEQTLTMKMQGGDMDEGMKRMQEQLARMSPEQRAQMEAMMASRGKGGPGLAAGMSLMSGKPTSTKICITPEQAARDQIPNGQGNCQQLSQERSGKTVKIKFSCTLDGGQAMTGDGQFTLVSDKEHTGHMVMDGVSRKGQPMHMEIDQAGRWLSTDCGDVKPRQMPPLPAKK